MAAQRKSWSERIALTDEVDRLLAENDAVLAEHRGPISRAKKRWVQKEEA